MSDDSVYSGLQGVFNTVFRRSDIAVTPQLSARDVPGWDSFRYVSLIAATEEHFGIQLQESDIEDLENVGDLAEAVARRIAAKGRAP
jgi:acyl carrier protein